MCHGLRRVAVPKPFFAFHPKREREKARKTFLVVVRFSQRFALAKFQHLCVLSTFFSGIPPIVKQPKQQPRFLPFSSTHLLGIGPENFDLIPLLPLCMPQTHPLLFFCQTSDTSFWGGFWFSRCVGGVAVLFSPTLWRYAAVLTCMPYGGWGGKTTSLHNKFVCGEEKPSFFSLPRLQDLASKHPPNHPVCACGSLALLFFLRLRQRLFFFPEWTCTTGYWSLPCCHSC